MIDVQTTKRDVKCDCYGHVVIGQRCDMTKQGNRRMHEPRQSVCVHSSRRFRIACTMNTGDAALQGAEMMKSMNTPMDVPYFCRTPTSHNAIVR